MDGRLDRVVVGFEGSALGFVVVVGLEEAEEAAGAFGLEAGGLLVVSFALETVDGFFFNCLPSDAANLAVLVPVAGGSFSAGGGRAAPPDTAAALVGSAGLSSALLSSSAEVCFSVCSLCLPLPDGSFRGLGLGATASSPGVLSCETARFSSSMTATLAPPSEKLSRGPEVMLLAPPSSPRLGLGLLWLPRRDMLGRSTETKLARILEVGRPSGLLVKLSCEERPRGSGEGEVEVVSFCSNMARSLLTPLPVPLPEGVDMAADGKAKQKPNQYMHIGIGRGMDRWGQVDRNVGEICTGD
jgi:hypothetical protein